MFDRLQWTYEGSSSQSDINPGETFFATVSLLYILGISMRSTPGKMSVPPEQAAELPEQSTNEFLLDTNPHLKINVSNHYEFMQGAR